MWERLNKVSIQVIIAVMTVVGSYGLLYLLTFKEIPAHNRDLFNVLVGAVIGSTLSAVIGWLYTTNKHNKPNP
jgi:uncharacterized metal-binding protein